MNKKYIFLAVTLLGMFLVSAGAVAINLTFVQLDMSKEGQNSITEVISFDCDGSPMEVNITEPDGKYDENDIKSSIGSSCSGIVTNIEMNGNTYKTNKYGMKSFDETLLKKDECLQDGNTWDKTQCLEIEEAIE